MIGSVAAVVNFNGSQMSLDFLIWLGLELVMLSSLADMGLVVGRLLIIGCVANEIRPLLGRSKV